MATVTIYWRDADKAITTIQDVEIEESLTLLTVRESETEYSRVPLAGVLYYDVEL